MRSVYERNELVILMSIKVSHRYENISLDTQSDELESFSAGMKKVGKEAKSWRNGWIDGVSYTV